VRQLLGGSADEDLVVLDVGANLGAWTVQALPALPMARIHSFEPSRVACGRLTTALSANPRVCVHNVALSDADGTATLYANELGSPLGSLTKRRLDHLGLEFLYEEQVTTRTMESWSSSVGIRAVDVLKLDVEGHELSVLRGAGQLLDGMRVIQFEFGGCNIDTRTYLQDFWYFLTAAGFRVYRLGPRGLRALDSYRERDECFSTTNFFASREM